jgi:hypothetical protein
MAVTLYDWTTATFSEEKKNGNKFEKSNKLYASVKCKYLD